MLLLVRSLPSVDWDQPGKVAIPPRGQLKKENELFLSTFAPEKLLISRDRFGRRVLLRQLVWSFLARQNLVFSHGLFYSFLPLPATSWRCTSMCYAAIIESVPTFWIFCAETKARYCLGGSCDKIKLFVRISSCSVKSFTYSYEASRILFVVISYYNVFLYSVRHTY